MANEQDAIEVCTTGGCVGLTPGETALVNPNTTNQQPSRTNARPTLPLATPVQAPQVVSNQSTPAGTPQAVTEAVYAPQSVQPQGVVVAEGTHPPETVPVQAPAAPTPPAPVPTPPPPVPTPPAPVPTPPAPVPTPPAPVPVPTPPAPVPTPPAPVPTPPSPAPNPPAPNPPAPNPPAPSPGITSVSNIVFVDRRAGPTAGPANPVNEQSPGGAQIETATDTVVRLIPQSGSPLIAISPVPAPSYVNGTVAGQDFLAIGQWTGFQSGVSSTPSTASDTPLAYAMGFPTALSVLDAKYDSVNHKAMRGTYSLSLGTPVTSDKSGVGAGSISTASLTVDFLSAYRIGELSVEVSMPATTSGGQTVGTEYYTLNGTVRGDNANDFSGKLTTWGAGCAGLYTCGNGTARGFFATGSGGQLGLTYNGYSSAHGNFGGAALLVSSSSPVTSPAPTNYGGASNQVAYASDNTTNAIQQFASSTSFNGAFLASASNGSGTTVNAPGYTNPVTEYGSTTNEPASTNFIGWGHWLGGTSTSPPANAVPYDNAHYITGVPLNLSSGRSRYSFVDGTTPTRQAIGGGIITNGSVTSATLDANFWTGTVKADVHVNFGSDIQITGTTTLTGGAFNTGGTSGDTFAGFIGGTYGEVAGLLYKKYIGGTDIVEGSAVLGLVTALPSNATANLRAAFAIGSGQTSWFPERTVSPTGANIYLQQGTGTLLERIVLNPAAPQVAGAHPGTAAVPFPTVTAGFSGTVAGGDFIGWGYWNTGTIEYSGPSSMSAVHYVVGTPSTNIATLTGTVMYNTIVNNTNATVTTGGSTASGTLITVGPSAPKLTADFSAHTVDFTASVKNVSNVQTDISVLAMPITAASASFSGTSTTGGATTAAGIFVGGGGTGNPTAVGVSFSQVSTAFSGSKVAGTVVLKP